MSAPAVAPPRWLPASVLGVAVLAFLPTLGGGFLGDDFVYIQRFRDLPWAQWPRLFVHEWSDGVWGMPLRELRPFAALSFMGDARLFGDAALGYRLTNLALHLLCTLLVLRLAWHYSLGRVAAALVAGLVFALHPVHAEAVSWITGRVDLQATAAALLFWLAAETFSARGGGARLALAGAAFFLGIFSKELCLFTPLLLLARWLLLDARAPGIVWRRRLAVIGVVAALLVAYAACRRAAFPEESHGYQLWTNEGAWQRQASYAGWLFPVLPFRGPEWRTFPSLATLHLAWLGVAAVTAAGLIVALRRRAPVAAAMFFFGGVWYLLSVYPLLGVGYFSPRHLYFPSVGLAVGAGLFCAAGGWRAALGGAFVAWCLAGHVAAVKPWRLAGHASQEALKALHRELAPAAPGTIVLTAVPETIGPALLWAWSSPALAQPPFTSPAPAAIVERAGNASQPERWFADRRPVETVQAAPGAVVLWMDDQGRITCRRVDRAMLQSRVGVLASTAQANALTPEAWTAWVKSIASP